MGTNMDALASFAYLIENLPKWLTQVGALATHATEKHTEFAAEYNRRLAQLEPKQTRLPTMESVHTRDEDVVESGQQRTQPTWVPSLPRPDEISPFEAGNRYLLAHSRRKRKPGSSIRSGASGPQRFRTKDMVVVYYDARVQEQLETLVKSIGGARNNLRKAKALRALRNGLLVPSLGRTYQNLSSTSSISSVGKPKSSDTAPLEVDNVKFNDNVAFTQADEQLESAQYLCETAAHQFLRDGDCLLELDNIRTKFDSVLGLATISAKQLRAEQEQEMEGDQPAPSDSDSTLIATPPTLSTTPPKLLLPTLNEKLEEANRTVAAGMMEIEVDDDSDASSMVVDISHFRTARNGMRV